MRRLLCALFTGAWIALLGTLVLPVPLALFAEGTGSTALTPLFYGLWCATAVSMYALGSVCAMARATLLTGAVLTVLISMLALWPPIDRITLAVAISMLPVSLAHYWAERKLVRISSRKGMAPTSQSREAAS